MDAYTASCTGSVAQCCSEAIVGFACPIAIYRLRDFAQCVWGIGREFQGGDSIRSSSTFFIGLAVWGSD